VLGGSVDQDEARRAFEPLQLADLERDGILAESDGRLRAVVRIAPFEGLLVAPIPRTPTFSARTTCSVSGPRRGRWRR